MTTTTTSSAASQLTPQQQALTNAVLAWEASLTEQSDDAASLKQAIERLAKLPPDEAFVQIAMAFASGDTQVQGDKVTITASLMNAGSAGSGIATEITSDISDIESGSSTAAADLVGAVGFLTTQMQNQLGLISSEGPQGKGVWIDGPTAGSVLSACKSITGLLGSDAAGNIQSWSADPTKTSSNGKTGSQNLQALNGYVSTLGNAFGGYSQMQNNALQFQNNQIGQVVTSSRALLQNIVTLMRALVASLKGN